MRVRADGGRAARPVPVSGRCRDALAGGLLVSKPPVKEPEVVILRHARAKFTRNSKGVLVADVPTQLSPEQTKDAANRHGVVIPFRK